jgi:hypothetical protein
LFSPVCVSNYKSNKERALLFVMRDWGFSCLEVYLVVRKQRVI